MPILRARITDEHSDTRRVERIAIIVLLAIGCVLRVAAFLQNRSLWFDEAMLARNLANRSFHQLIEPLSYNQGAPLGYLAASKTSLLTLGLSDYGFRAVSILAALGSLFFFAKLSERCLTGSGRVAACALFVLCPSLVYYAAEAKQFSVDVFVAVMLSYVALRVIESASAKGYLALSVVGVVAVWFSHPVVFVMATLGVWMFSSAVWSGRRREIIAVGLVGFAWIGSLTVVYLLNLRSLSNNETLLAYWSTQFFPHSPLDGARWAWNAYWTLFVEPFGDPAGYLVAWLFAVGLATLAVTRPGLAWLCAGPCLFALLASGLRLYPFAGRLMLFAVPVLILGSAAGWQAIAADRRRAVSGTLAAAVLLSMLNSSVERVFIRREDLRPLITKMGTQARPGDRVYVYRGAEPQFSLYAQDLGYLTGRELQIAKVDRWMANSVEYEKQLSSFRGTGRVWLVHSHDLMHTLTDEELLLSAARKFGRELESFRATGASISLFEFQ